MSETRLPQRPRMEARDKEDTKNTPTSSVTPQSSDTVGGEDVFLFLIASRILNALVLQTFFQPDEYFQALEPGWNFAFGPGSGAWITWEWKNYLRSSIHPVLFSLLYKAAEAVSSGLGLAAPWRANLLLVAPRIGQALIAATGDYYTWRLADYVYGGSSLTTAATLILTIVSPWQWFCSTRTFSNSLETTLTITALYYWPWHWSMPAKENDGLQLDSHGLRKRGNCRSSTETTFLRWALVAAALATILRPTNILVWVALVALAVRRGVKGLWVVKAVDTQQTAPSGILSWLRSRSKSEFIVFVREVVLCGSAAIALSGVLDRIFYHSWTFPPLNFVHFNVVQSIAIFYGNNDWHYYLSQGYPLLLTTALPFALIGIYNAIARPHNERKLSETSQAVLSDLAVVSLFVPAVLSIISHKEVRFIYPLLPGLHILAAQPIYSFFAPVFQPAILASTRRIKYAKASLLFLLVSLNLTIAIYTSQIHNSGLISTMHYLRHQFEDHYGPTASSNMTVGFLMPCHSTPWRSHLQYPPAETSAGIDAWALTCEPPLHLNATEKAVYLDEADQFYAAPLAWLKRHMSRHPPTINGKSTLTQGPEVFAGGQQQHRRMLEVGTGEQESTTWRESNGRGRRPWPQYLAFFQQLEPELTRSLSGSGYTECWRGFNSHWHDDWRRQGDVIVWCLFPERRVSTTVVTATSLVSADTKNKETERQKTLPYLTVEKPFWKQQQPLVEDEVADRPVQNKKDEL